jgi:hypothetical protein
MMRSHRRKHVVSWMVLVPTLVGAISVIRVCQLRASSARDWAHAHVQAGKSANAAKDHGPGSAKRADGGR